MQGFKTARPRKSFGVFFPFFLFIFNQLVVFYLTSEFLVLCVRKKCAWQTTWLGKSRWEGESLTLALCNFNPSHRQTWEKSVFPISVQFSRSVVSDSLWPNEPQHTRPPCPSPAPRVHPDSYASSRWCHPAISSSVVPFSSCPQSLPASGSFPMSQLFVSGGQSTGVSASASILPMNTQDWYPLGWTGWISLLSKGLSRVFSNTTVQKQQFFGAQLSSQRDQVWSLGWENPLEKGMATHSGILAWRMCVYTYMGKRLTSECDL